METSFKDEDEVVCFLCEDKAYLRVQFLPESPVVSVCQDCFDKLVIAHYGEEAE